MLETKCLGSTTEINTDELTEILSKLAEQHWDPIIYKSQITILSLFKRENDIQFLISDQIKNSLKRLANGDVILKDKDLYYITIYNQDNNPDFNERLYLQANRMNNLSLYEILENTKPGIEIGLISPTSKDLDARLRSFALMIEQAINTSNNKDSSLIFDWREINIDTAKLNQVIATAEKEETSNIKFEKAELIQKECKAANVMKDKLFRETLIEISQAGFAREKDIIIKKGKSQEEMLKIIQDLKSLDLLTTQYLLECKTKNTPLTYFRDLHQIEFSEVKDLICPSCNKKFSEETLTERYSLSELGYRMSRKSHWMTVYVTMHLVDLGIPIETMLWNIAEGSEEIDLLVDFLGKFWIFELKDKEFGSGNAHAFSFRQVRYQADKGFIVTTDKVSKDAKIVFDELKKARRLGRSSSPVYIEGLHCLESNLHKEISMVRNQYAKQKLEIVKEISGYDLYTMYEQKINQMQKND